RQVAEHLLGERGLGHGPSLSTPPHCGIFASAIACAMWHEAPMTPNEADDPGLARSLSRARVALAKTGPAARRPRRKKSSAGPAPMKFGLAALGMFTVAFATGIPSSSGWRWRWPPREASCS